MHQQDEDDGGFKTPNGTVGNPGTVLNAPGWTGTFNANITASNPANWTVPASQSLIGNGNLNYTFVEKTSVVYVIIVDKNTTLRLEEQAMITPREMINIAKFINMINNYLVAAISRIQLTVNWQTLIKTLKIEKHFVTGPGADAYDLDTEVLYVFVSSK